MPLAVLVVMPLLVLNAFLLNVFVNIYVNVIMATGVYLLIRAGLLSMAPAAFMGIGGYTSALLTMKYGVPFLMAFISSGLMGAMVALAIGKVILGLKDVYFVLMTFAFGEVIRLLFQNLRYPFGGATGLVGIPRPEISLIPGITWEFSTRLDYYYFALAIAVICLAFAQRLLRSNFGRGLACTREAEYLAEATGIDTMGHKVMAFTISSFFCGLAGSIFAHYYHYISPPAFTFWRSVDLIVMNVVGGMGSLAGPIVGAFFLTPLPEFLRGFVDYQYIIYGLIIIFVMRFAPGGMAAAASEVLCRTLGRRGRGRAVDEPLA